jgi:tRNA G18 (ribose-2'-O)-methylase SpoU
MERIDVVAVNIRSALNVGALFRSADAFGTHKIWLAGYSAPPDHPDVKKTALGAEKTVAWEKADDAIACIERLKASGCRIVGLERVLGAKALHEYQPSFPTAIVIGNEVEGLSHLVMRACDDMVEIRQYGTKESLNVMVAAGIAMYAFRESST